MDLTEIMLSRETVFTGKVFTAHVDQVQCPNGVKATRELICHNGGVGVLAIDENDFIIMVRQYRYGAGKVLLEIPAGKLEKDEDPKTAGIRELSEETGFVAKNFTSLGITYPTGAYDSEIIHLYLAEGLTSGDAHPDEDEFVIMEKIHLSKLEEMALNGEIDDAKTLIALYRYKLLKEKR